MPRPPSLRSLFFAWVCFSLAFSTVFQAFLTSFLVDSGYKTPIQNMDELFVSGFKLAYHPGHSYIIENGDEREASKLQRNLAKFPSFFLCLDLATNHRNMSVLVSDLNAEIYYASRYFIGENSEPILCSLKDGVVFHSDTVVLMLQGDPLLRRVNEIIRRVVEAGLYIFWTSMRIHQAKLHY
jgi:hypothetical protein